jgi:hypothetical protein
MLFFCQKKNEKKMGSKPIKPSRTTYIYKNTLSESATFYDPRKRENIVTIKPNKIHRFLTPPWKTRVFTKTQNISPHHSPQKPGYFMIVPYKIIEVSGFS